MTTAKTKPATKPAAKTARKKPTASRAAVGATSARVEQMRLTAFEMLARGYKCPEIGATLGVSRIRAWQLASEGLEQLKSETKDKAEEYRFLQTERHMRRMRALDEIIEAKDAKGAFLNDAATRTAATAKATGIEAELAKLWGSYMPTKSEVTGANGTSLVPAPSPSHDLTKLSGDQLMQLHALAVLATPVQKDPETS